MGWSKLREKARVLLSPLVKIFSFIPPNILTFSGILIVLLAAAFIFNGRFRLGGVILIVGSIFDALDGQIARKTGKMSEFGAFFDSTLDRYGEFFIFFSIAFTGDSFLVFLCFAAMLGSFLTSYTRARADSLGVDIKEGLLTRVERIIILIIGLVILPEHLVYIMAILAIGSNLTAIQRIIIAYKRL